MGANLTRDRAMERKMADQVKSLKSSKTCISKNGKVYKPLKLLTLHASKLKNAVYQRSINPSKVRDIMNDFRMELLNPIKVGLRDDGSYYIIDGQHSYMAVTQLFGEDVELACVLVESSSKDWEHLTDEQKEARAFAHQHDNTKKLSINEKFKASLVGREDFALNILNICRENRFVLSYKDGQTASKDTIVCTNTIINIYEKDNGKLLNDTLKVLRAAYNGSSDSIQSLFIKFVSSFIMKYRDEENYSDAKLIKVLSTRILSPTDFTSEAKNDADLSKAKFGIKRTIDYCAELKLLDCYNKRRTTDNRLLLK